MANKVNVGHSTVHRILCSIGSSLPRSLGGHPATLSAHTKRLLAWKVTSGAADTAPQLKKHLALNVTTQTIRNTLRKAGLKAAVKQKSLFFQRLTRGGSWSLLLSTSTGLWMTGAGWFGQMRPRLMGWGQMGGLGYGRSLVLPWGSSMSVGQ